jgi:hypothetical protein
MKQLILLLATLALNVFGQLMMKRDMSMVGVISGDMSAIASTLARTLSRVDPSYAYPALSLGYVPITLVRCIRHLPGRHHD